MVKSLNVIAIPDRAAKLLSQYDTEKVQRLFRKEVHL